MRISDAALGAGMPVCVSASLHEFVGVRACRMCGNMGATWVFGWAESQDVDPLSLLSAVGEGGGRVAVWYIQALILPTNPQRPERRRTGHTGDTRSHDNCCLAYACGERCARPPVSCRPRSHSLAVGFTPPCPVERGDPRPETEGE